MYVEGIRMNEKSNYDNLVDIRDISVDSSLSKFKRVAEFGRQIKNPYKFRCSKYIVTVKYNAKGPTIEECLQTLMT